MRFSGEGTIGIVLGLLGCAGVGVPMVMPQYLWLGWVFIGIALIGFILLGCNHLFGRRQEGSDPGSLLPDIPVSEAVDYIVNDTTTPLRSSPKGYDPAAVGLFPWTGEQHMDALEQIFQQATLGQLHLWGQMRIGPPSAQRYGDALREIPKGYWESADFNVLFCFHASDSPQTRSQTGDENLTTYKRLTLNRGEVKRLWPQKRLLRRFRDWATRKPRLYRDSQVREAQAFYSKRGQRSQ
nr:hypothetical protein [uncultured Rhodopila sp.]